MDDLDETERAVLDHVTATGDSHVSFLKELIRAKPVNPPGNEERAAAVIRPRLETLGFEVDEYTEVEGRPNLVARLPGGDGPTLLPNAHLDVVPVRELVGPVVVVAVGVMRALPLSVVVQVGVGQGTGRVDSIARVEGERAVA
jgi:hypothetical protein